MYAALVLSPNDQNPRFIPLFEQKQLDSLLHTAGERKADYVNALYTIAERGTKPLGKPKKSLYELLWKPLEKHLAGVNTIYYSPSGLLHRLNLAAIPIGLDSVLADRYHLVELGSTRSRVLGIIPTTIQSAANDAALFGGVQYDSDSTAITQANAALDSISIASRGELSFTYTDSTLRVGTWSDLPFTDREITGIERIMQTAGIETETRRGYLATEESFKSIGAGKKPSPRILHIATHGFFFPDPKDTLSRSPFRGVGGAEPVFKLSDHPMIRSGLILAGGNHAWATGKPIKPGLEDGILTAYEISQMNLSNTELVVLSACETGLGDIQGNEGVYGLQRAFKIAGAKYLIMSLWQVPDKQTSLLMTTF
ncbi:MAG: CHAT domain-containing protein, partial [Thermoanaerobaculia bacterium]|nr:CHAT domain-containing protein [Thermoanaerobaculia bacterium]